MCEGCSEGVQLGCDVGQEKGLREGVLCGCKDGKDEGPFEGREEGIPVGFDVGAGFSTNKVPLLSPTTPMLEAYIYIEKSACPVDETNTGFHLLPPSLVTNISPCLLAKYAISLVTMEIICGGNSEVTVVISEPDLNILILFQVKPPSIVFAAKLLLPTIMAIFSFT